MYDSVIYLVAKEHLGHHLTLNPNVPEEVGCAEAVSFILKAAGYAMPSGGIAGVNALIAWLTNNGFVEVSYPSPGDIITAHSSDVNDPNFAHTGVCMVQGIASNNSSNGIFSLNYSYDRWNNYFGNHGSETRYFSAQK